MTRKAAHLYRLLAFLDPLLCCPALVVEAHYRPARRLQVSHDEPHSGEQLPEVELHFRHDSSCCLPTYAKTPVIRVYECRAAHTAGVKSGRHRIGRSASPGRIVEK